MRFAGYPACPERFQECAKVVKIAQTIMKNIKNASFQFLTTLFITKVSQGFQIDPKPFKIRARDPSFTRERADPPSFQRRIRIQGDFFSITTLAGRIHEAVISCKLAEARLCLHRIQT